MTNHLRESRGSRLLRFVGEAALTGVAAAAVIAAPALATPALAADEPDTTPPSMIGAAATPPVSGIHGSLWYNGPATLQIWAQDPSGVTITFEVHEDGLTGPTVTVTGDESALAYPEFTVEGEGWVTYRAVDGAGNATPETRMNVTIDATAPVVAVTPGALSEGGAEFMEGAEEALSIECLDAHECLVQLADGSAVPALLPTDEPGEQELALHTEDVFGNVRDVVLRYTVLPAEPENPDGPDGDPVQQPDGDPAPQPRPEGAPALQSAADRAPLLAETGAEDAVAGAALGVGVVIGGVLLLMTERRRRHMTTAR
jgi:hypothetical protein